MVLFRRAYSSLFQASSTPGKSSSLPGIFAELNTKAGASKSIGYKSQSRNGTGFERRPGNQPSSVPSIPLITTANEATTNVQHLMTHFSKILTKHGRRGEDVIARVSAILRHRYQHASPIPLAIDAIKPVLKYQKFKNAKSYVPIVLHPKPSAGIAIRWIVEAAGKRMYVGQRPCIERGLVDELDAIIQGTSTLYTRRVQFHKNPN